MSKESNRDTDNNSNKTSSFKVEDKRGFNSDGSERVAPVPASQNDPYLDVPPSSQNFILKEDVSTDEQSGGEASLDSGSEEVNFVSFMMSLATQGMMQLGEMAAPAGHAVPVSLEHAKQTIDILSMLQEKTRGNLDEFEGGLVEEVLHSLRMAYVAKSA